MSDSTVTVPADRLLVIRDALSLAIEHSRPSGPYRDVNVWDRCIEARAILDVRLLCPLGVEVALAPPTEPTFRDFVAEKTT